MAARYVVGLCDEPKWFSKADKSGVVRYYPPIIDRHDRQDYGYRHLAFQNAEVLSREKAVCDFEKGIGGRCAMLLEYDGTCVTIYAFDKNGKQKRLEEPSCNSLGYSGD